MNYFLLSLGLGCWDEQVCINYQLFSPNNITTLERIGIIPQYVNSEYAKNKMNKRHVESTGWNLVEVSNGVCWQGSSNSIIINLQCFFVCAEMAVPYHKQGRCIKEHKKRKKNKTMNWNQSNSSTIKVNKPSGAFWVICDVGVNIIIIYPVLRLSASFP